MLSPARSSENCGELQNIHTLFRREIDLENGAIQCAGLFITADDYYKLYINGNFVGGGPALAHPRDYHYNGWDVTDLLRDGKTNCIGMHVYYQGLYNLAFISGDNLQGMLLQLEIELEDGSRRTVVSDQNWRCHQTDAYEGRQLYGYQTAFSEHIDLRRFPAGWSEPGFDDRGLDRTPPRGGEDSSRLPAEPPADAPVVLAPPGPGFDSPQSPRALLHRPRLRGGGRNWIHGERQPRLGGRDPPRGGNTLLTGVVPPGERRPILDFLRRKRMSCGV